MQFEDFSKVKATPWLDRLHSLKTLNFLSHVNLFIYTKAWRAAMIFCFNGLKLSFFISCTVLLNFSWLVIRQKVSTFIQCRESFEVQASWLKISQIASSLFTFGHMQFCRFVAATTSYSLIPLHAKFVTSSFRYELSKFYRFW